MEGLFLPPGTKRLLLPAGDRGFEKQKFRGEDRQKASPENKDEGVTLP
jgi:hypothetical protein